MVFRECQYISFTSPTMNSLISALNHVQVIAVHQNKTPPLIIFFTFCSISILLFITSPLERVIHVGGSSDISCRKSGTLLKNTGIAENDRRVARGQVMNSRKY